MKRPQAKDELGWADYRLTDAPSIERWWELVMCASLFVSPAGSGLGDRACRSGGARLSCCRPAASGLDPRCQLDTPLNNLRLLFQPFVCTCLLLPWLQLYPLPHLTAGLADLCALMNTYRPLYPT